MQNKHFRKCLRNQNLFQKKIVIYSLMTYSPQFHDMQFYLHFPKKLWGPWEPVSDYEEP